jgi:hypothetical protein
MKFVFLWNMKMHNHLPLVPVLNKINPSHASHFLSVPRYFSQSSEHISCFPKRPACILWNIPQLQAYSCPDSVGIHQVGEQVLTDFQLDFCIALYARSSKPTALPLDVSWSNVPFSLPLFLLMFSNFYTRCMEIEEVQCQEDCINSADMKQLFSNSMLWDYEIKNLDFLLFKSTGFLK